ncbi:MAG: cytidylate kinase, partial [Caulobacteraceae bacterium]|nr:cytidylate kinase [Caulobacter sp.]
APDAVRLDTTGLDIAQAAEAARRVVAEAHARWRAAREP